MQLNELGSDWRGFTNTTVSLTGSAQTITLNAPSRHFVINNLSTNTLSMVFDGSTPSTSTFTLAANQAVAIDGLPAIAVGNFKVISSAASGSVSVLAW